jgi:hypothetical protein
VRLILTLVFAAAVLCPGAALAYSQTFDFSGSPIVGEDENFTPDVSIQFTYDTACSGSCSLEIMMTYNDSGGLSTIGETLAGVHFDVMGSLVFAGTGVVMAEDYVGSGAAEALSDLGLNVTGHYALGQANVFGVDGYAFGSVGDINFGEATLGAANLLPGTISGVEPNPPNGTDFSIVDPNAIPNSGGFQAPVNPNPSEHQLGVWIQNSITASLNYDGSLGENAIVDVTPYFGTDGAPIPEPSSALLYAAGLLVVGRATRRRR